VFGAPFFFENFGHPRLGVHIVLILGERRFIKVPFDSEEELERAVVANSEYLFGRNSLFFPKSLIRTKDGFGTIPDGFVMDLASRRWFIVEAELSKHLVWTHIAPQVAKQLVASSQSSSKRRLIELAVDTIRNDPDFLGKFEEQEIQEIDIAGVLGEILEGPPIIALPIDAVPNDLREWADTLKVEVKLWLVEKHVEFGKPENVICEIPEEEFGPENGSGESEAGRLHYDVTLVNLIQAGLLHVGEKVYMPYKPPIGEKMSLEATIEAGGEMSVLGKTFPTPSYAAVYALQQAGSNRTTANGWTSWKTVEGVLLKDLRDKYLQASQKPQESA
jgi:hypothetical protein